MRANFGVRNMRASFGTHLYVGLLLGPPQNALGADAKGLGGRIGGVLRLSVEADYLEFVFTGVALPGCYGGDWSTGER